MGKNTDILQVKGYILLCPKLPNSNPIYYVELIHSNLFMHTEFDQLTLGYTNIDKDEGKALSNSKTNL